MPKKYQRLLLAIFPIALLTIMLFSSRITLADDPCKSITDLDDRAKCYENEIAKNEEKYQSTNKKLTDIRSQKDSVNGKINTLLSQLNVTQSDLDDIQAEIDDMNKKLVEIGGVLAAKNDELSSKLSLRNRVIRTYVKKGVLNELETLFASSGDSLNGFQHSSMAYIFGKTLNDETLKLIGLISGEIDSYEKDKKLAEDLKAELLFSQQSLIAAVNKIEADKKLAQNDLNTLAGKEENYEKELKSLGEKISDLSSRQQEVLKKKFGDSNGSVGDYEAPEWSVPNPPFKPAFAACSLSYLFSEKGAYARTNPGCFIARRRSVNPFKNTF